LEKNIVYCVNFVNYDYSVILIILQGLASFSAPSGADGKKKRPPLRGLSIEEQ